MWIASVCGREGAVGLGKLFKKCFPGVGIVPGLWRRGSLRVEQDVEDITPP